MIPINELISERLINALGWTIIHSLWQISFIALGYYLLTSFFNKERSQSRYNLGILSLIALLGTTGITFWRVYSSYIPNSLAPNIVQLKDGMAQQAGSSSSLISVIQGFISQHMPFIVGLWFLGVMILVFQFIKDYVYNLRISNYPSRKIPEKWEKRLSNLCRKMNLNKIVKIKETVRIHTPMTIGHLKPIIFFPVGLLAGIPVDQVEAIIAHELAHIIRRDYLINILQNFIDIFFFYHPGVRWISARIRAERENCCDDIAVDVVGDSIKFAKALASIQVWNVKQPVLAMNANGRRDKLFHRIRRVTKMKQKGTRSSEGLVGACVLGLFLVIAGIGANAASMVPEKVERARMKSISFFMEKEGTITVRVEATVKGTIHCFIKDKKKGLKYYNLKENLDGNPFLYFTDVNLKSGDYKVSWTDNCKVTVRKKQPSPEAALKKYQAKIEKLKAKGENLSSEEKEKLLKLYQLSKQLEYEMKKKAAQKNRVKVSKKAEHEIQKREMAIKKLYLKRKQIEAKGDSLTEKDKKIIKKCEILIKEHRMAIKKIKEKEKHK